MGGRPRGYETSDVVRAARDLFWERGYEATSLAELEERTGLNRSSIYQVFGSKRELFNDALRSYLQEIAEPRLIALEGPHAGLTDVVTYLNALADVLRADQERAQRGCLVVNTITEISGRDGGARDIGRAYRDRIVGALAHALLAATQRGEIDVATAQARARILATTVIGILVTAHLDPGEAAEIARITAEEVSRWTDQYRPRQLPE